MVATNLQNVAWDQPYYEKHHLASRNLCAQSCSKLDPTNGVFHASGRGTAPSVTFDEDPQLGEESQGRWSVWVNGNWRLTFEFRDGHAYVLDYEDYH